MPTLFLRLTGPARRTEEGHYLEAEWLIAEGDGSVRSSGKTDLRGLSELIDPATDWLANPGNVVVLIPGELVLNVNCEVPGRNPAQIRRALPFVVEEFVASDIETMHVSAGAIGRSGVVRSLVTEIALIDDWLATLSDVGIHPGYLLPDAELLPAAADHTTVLYDSNMVLLRSIDNMACLDAENLEFVLQSFIEQSGDETVLEAVNGELDPLLVAQLPPECTVRTTSLETDETVLSYLARQWAERGPLPGNAINLLQGPYAVTLDGSSAGGRFRSLATLAAVWFGVAVLGLAAKAYVADQEAARLTEETESLYGEIYPDDRRVPPDIRRQMLVYMGQSTGDTAAFTPLVGHLSKHVDSSIKVRSFNYQGTRNELSSELILADFGALDELKDRLSEGGISVEIASADQQSDGIHARIRMRGPGGV